MESLFFISYFCALSNRYVPSKQLIKVIKIIILGFAEVLWMGKLFLTPRGWYIWFCGARVLHQWARRKSDFVRPRRYGLTYTAPTEQSTPKHNSILLFAIRAKFVILEILKEENSILKTLSKGLKVSYIIIEKVFPTWAHIAVFL